MCQKTIQESASHSATAGTRAHTEIRALPLWMPDQLPAHRGPLLLDWLPWQQVMIWTWANGLRFEGMKGDLQIAA